MTPEFWLQLALGLGGAVAVYVGIRVDLAVQRERVTAAKEAAAHCHGRLDEHINLHHVKGA